MNFINYQKEIIKQSQEYDVIVIGGGSAGICAAIASAREGAKTLLIEETGWLGGIGTTGGMVEFGPIKRNGFRIMGGIPFELINRMNDFGGAEFINDVQSMYFSPETYAHVAMKMCRETNVELMLHTKFVDCIVKDNKIEGIVICTKEGLSICSSHIYIDCTGDGNVFFSAGVPWSMGRDKDRLAQPMTLVFFAADVNYNKFWEACKGDMITYLTALIQKARKYGDFNIPITRPGSIGYVPKYGKDIDLSRCEVFINCSNIIGKSGINTKELTDAECESREQIYEIFNFFQKYVSGFENTYLSFVPTSIGVRETRRVHGSYVLKKDDLITGRKFDDTIAIGFNQIDIHQVQGHDFDLTVFSDDHYYSIPYRCLHTGEFKNLLIAGRCISVDHEALGAVRVMVNTMPVGEAAGTAAALAVKNNISVWDVPINDLQKTLKLNNAVIEKN